MSYDKLQIYFENLKVLMLTERSRSEPFHKKWLDHMTARFDSAQRASIGSLCGAEVTIPGQFAFIDLANSKSPSRGFRGKIFDNEYFVFLTHFFTEKSVHQNQLFATADYYESQWP
jgi:hypothetical protein